MNILVWCHVYNRAVIKNSSQSDSTSVSITIVQTAAHVIISNYIHYCVRCRSCSQ